MTARGKSFFAPLLLSSTYDLSLSLFWHEIGDGQPRRTRWIAALVPCRW